MPKVNVYNMLGELVEEMELSDAVFGVEVNEHVVYEVVKNQLANKRQGTQSAKTRAEVRGGGRKPWRQKGTGRARQGSTRTPQWRGGGVVFGPLPERNYHQDVPKKLRWLAWRSAYNAHARDEAVILVEGLEFDAPKTKRVIALLEGTGATGNVLILTDGHKPLVHLSARNIPGVQVASFGQESAYNVLWADTLIIEASA